MKKNSLFLLLIIFMLLSQAHQSCAFELVRNDKDIKGKVVDAVSGKPIQGVVVYAGWSSSFPTPAGPKYEYYDLYETTTDENGDFFIQGQGFMFFTTVESPSISLFKAGYDDMYLHDLGEKFKKYSRFKKNVRWEEDKAIIPLIKLSMEERKRRSVPVPSSEGVSFEKVKRLLEEINKERVETGRKPYTIWGGHIL
ncbi:MAG: carboxypeptidase-like regulatory domain-containing protein [Desulfobulbaceae bacterium]|nr:carboxypeptidase-like regulatory domain-containing protein [Desulfobulbaceae bacterium]